VFYPQYVQLVVVYNIGKLATFLAKNVWSSLFGEQKLLTKFSTIFVIHVLDVATVKRLVEVHNKHTERHDFAMNFEVSKKDFFFSFWFANFFMKFPI
jgi:hypothetical protein